MWALLLWHTRKARGELASFLCSLSYCGNSTDVKYPKVVVGTRPATHQPRLPTNLSSAIAISFWVVILILINAQVYLLDCNFFRLHIFFSLRRESEYYCFHWRTFFLNGNDRIGNSWNGTTTAKTPVVSCP